MCKTRRYRVSAPRESQRIRYFSKSERSLTPSSLAHLGIAPRPEYSSPCGPRNWAGTFLPRELRLTGPLSLDVRPLAVLRLRPGGEETSPPPNLSSSARNSLIRFPRISSIRLVASATRRERSSNEYPEISGIFGITDPRSFHEPRLTSRLLVRNYANAREMVNRNQSILAPTILLQHVTCSRPPANRLVWECISLG